MLWKSCTHPTHSLPLYTDTHFLLCVSLWSLEFYKRWNTREDRGKPAPAVCLAAAHFLHWLSYMCWFLVGMWDTFHPLPGIFWLMGLNFRNNFCNVLIRFMKHINITHREYACEGFCAALLWQGVETENSPRLVVAQSGVLQGAKSRAGCPPSV